MGHTAALSAKPSTALSTATPIALGISTIGDTISNYNAQRAQADYAAGIYNVNARFAEVEAEDSIARGEYQADEVARRASKNMALIRQKAKQITGSQRAAFAGQGIESTSGSAADVLADTSFLEAQDLNEIDRSAKLDVITIKNNAWREAWGYKTQAQIYGSAGRMALLAGRATSRNTLLNGGLKTLGYGLESYNQYTRTRKTA